MKNHYINNEDFESTILSYQQEPEIYEDALVSLFDILITNIIESFRFKVDPDDAKQECFALVLKTVKNFKPRKGTAFNLKLMYTREKKYNIKIENYIEKKKEDLK